MDDGYWRRYSVKTGKEAAREWHAERREMWHVGRKQALNNKIAQSYRCLTNTFLQRFEEIEFKMWATARLLTSRGRWQICKTSLMLRIAGIVDTICEFLPIATRKVFMRILSEPKTQTLAD